MNYPHIEKLLNFIRQKSVAKSVWKHTFVSTLRRLDARTTTVISYGNPYKAGTSTAGYVNPVNTRIVQVTAGYSQNSVNAAAYKKNYPVKAAPKNVTKGNPRRFVNTETYYETLRNRVIKRTVTDKDDTVISLMNTYVTLYDQANHATFRSTSTTTGTAVRSLGQTGFGPQDKYWVDTVQNNTALSRTNNTGANQKERRKKLRPKARKKIKYISTSNYVGREIVLTDDNSNTASNSDVITYSVISCNTPRYKSVMKDAVFFRTRIPTPTYNQNDTHLYPWGDKVKDLSACKILETGTFDVNNEEGLNKAMLRWNNNSTGNVEQNNQTQGNKTYEVNQNITPQANYRTQPTSLTKWLGHNFRNPNTFTKKVYVDSSTSISSAQYKTTQLAHQVAGGLTAIGTNYVSGSKQAITTPYEWTEGLNNPGNTASSVTHLTNASSVQMQLPQTHWENKVYIPT